MYSCPAVNDDLHPNALDICSECMKKSNWKKMVLMFNLKRPEQNNLKQDKETSTTKLKNNSLEKSIREEFPGFFDIA